MKVALVAEIVFISITLSSPQCGLDRIDAITDCIDQVMCCQQLAATEAARMIVATIT